MSLYYAKMIYHPDHGGRGLSLETVALLTDRQKYDLFRHELVKPDGTATAPDPKPVEMTDEEAAELLIAQMVASGRDPVAAREQVTRHLESVQKAKG